MSSPPFAAAPRARFAVSSATVIAICAVALTILGLTILFSASASARQGPYFYLTKQLGGVALAALLCFIASRIDLDYARRYAPWVAGVSLVMLVLVLLPGLGVRVNGSRRWLGLGGVRLQVSEFAKLGVVFCLAHWLALQQTRIGEFRRGYLYPLAFVGTCGWLVLREPDFGTATLIVGVGLLLMFLAGVNWRYLLATLPLLALFLAWKVSQNTNRKGRFLAFLDVEANKANGTYQLWQALAAFASGGVEGTGLGQGRQQLNFLPEAHTDMIFAVIGEELGLGATLAVVAVFAVMFVAGLRHLRRAPNLFQFLLVAGCVLLISLQAVVNLGVVTGLFPTKGMSLPFISAGLSNLLLMGLLVGVILNTDRRWGRAPRRTPERDWREALA